MKVIKIMHKVMIVEEDISLKQAAILMSKKRIGSLIYAEAGEIKGIITERDIIKNISDLNKTASKVMHKKVFTVDADSNLEDAAKVMKKNKIKRLPVVVGDELVGIVTATDLIAHMEGFELF